MRGVEFGKNSTLTLHTLHPIFDPPKQNYIRTNDAQSAQYSTDKTVFRGTFCLILHGVLNFIRLGVFSLRRATVGVHVRYYHLYRAVLIRL